MSRDQSEKQRWERMLEKLDPWEQKMVAEAEFEDWVVRAFVVIAFGLGMVLGLSLAS